MARTEIVATRFLNEGEPGRLWRRSLRRRYDSKPRRHQELVVLAGLQGRMRYFIDDTLLDFGPGTLLFAHSVIAYLSRNMIQHLDEQSAGVLARAAEAGERTP